MNAPSPAAGRTGILLLNLGGPDSLRAVRPFLTSLFTDREILRLPGGAVGQAVLGRVIAWWRTPAAKRNYALIGGRSPIHVWTDRQMAGLASRLRERGHDVAIAAAMRYTAPTTQDALDRLISQGVTRLLAFTLYPQYSVATTGASLNELDRVLRREQVSLPVDRIESWADHPGYLDAFAERVRTALAGFAPDAKPTLLFSAHGLPRHFVDAGDPYCDQIRATMEGILDRIGRDRPVMLGYQSRVGPMKWTRPRTDERIRELAAAGVKSVLVIPVSFVSDHIETLYEVDMLFGDLARSLGISDYRRIESLNDFPPFLDALADLAAARLGSPAAAPAAATRP